MSMALRRFALTSLAVALAMVVECAGVVMPATAALPGPAETQLLSVADASPPQAANDQARQPSMSSDGHYVVFTSPASNLGSLKTAARHDQVYLRDAVGGTTRAISAAAGQLGDGDSDRAVISGDGMFVAFISTANNLVAASRSSNAQVLLWSRATDSLSLVSVSNDPVPSASNGRATGVAISDDGKRIVYSSNATNLVPQNTFASFQIFSRDTTTGLTSLVSIDPRTPGAGASSTTTDPAISGDGRVVAFTTAAPLTSIDPCAKFQVYTRELSTGTLRMISVGLDGVTAGAADSVEPSLSRDGALVAFSSSAPNVSSQFGSNGLPQIYLRDVNASSTSVVSVDAAGRSLSNGRNAGPKISNDGTMVAFTSSATNLVPETGGSPAGIRGGAFVRSLKTNHTILACRGADGSICDGYSASPALSATGALVAFQSDATNIVPEVPSRNAQIYLHDSRTISRVDRIGGEDRFAVAGATASDAFATGVPVAYVASGSGFADALSGSAAAGAERGPVLLVTKDTIPTLAGLALLRLKPQRIVLLGGTDSVNTNVEAALFAYSPTVTRVAGADRYEVSAKVSASVFGRAGTPGGEHPPVYIASGSVFPDALSGSAAAGAVGGPVLLVTKEGIPVTVAAELKRLAPSKIIALGGSNTISDAVVTSLGATAPTSRIGGVDRFAVSASVSASSFGSGVSTVYVASGAVFPDALSGSAAAMQNRGPVLLVSSDRIPDAVAAELTRLKPSRIVVLGGQNTVSDAVVHDLAKYLAPA